MGCATNCSRRTTIRRCLATRVRSALSSAALSAEHTCPIHRTPCHTAPPLLHAARATLTHCPALRTFAPTAGGSEPSRAPEPAAAACSGPTRYHTPQYRIDAAKFVLTDGPGTDIPLLKATVEDAKSKCGIVPGSGRGLDALDFCSMSLEGVDQVMSEAAYVANVCVEVCPGHQDAKGTARGCVGISVCLMVSKGTPPQNNACVLYGLRRCLETHVPCRAPWGMGRWCICFPHEVCRQRARWPTSRGPSSPQSPPWSHFLPLSRPQSAQAALYQTRAVGALPRGARCWTSPLLRRSRRCVCPPLFRLRHLRRAAEPAGRRLRAGGLRVSAL